MDRLPKAILVAGIIMAARGGQAGHGGTVIGWGRSSFGETNISSGLTNCVAVAAGQ